MSAELHADLAAVDQAEQMAALYQLFEAECTEMGDPLSERQRLAWHKSLARTSDGTKHRLEGILGVSEQIEAFGRVPSFYRRGGVDGS